MNPDELISELLQALTNDVQRLQKQVAKLPTQPPADYRANIETLGSSAVSYIFRRLASLTG